MLLDVFHEVTNHVLLEKQQKFGTIENGPLCQLMWTIHKKAVWS